MADTIRSARDFAGDVQTEMQKVTWPDWPQIKNSTFVIVVFTVVIALLIGGLDVVLTAVLDLLSGVLGGG
jgi:preprotein translocase subunit SecE